MKVFEKFGCGDESGIDGGAGNFKGFLIGVECEIESVLSTPDHTGFKVEKDGSLRNNGLEFISYPMNKDTFLKHFRQLHDNLKLGDNPFSERTSTHVHVNVANIELMAAKNMVLLYALFEEFFFMAVKPERRENIHCVPLTETYMPSLYNKPMPHLVDKWHKYTALNLKRVADLGTIEFRHLHGTNNVKEVEEWLSTLENLWVLAQQETINKTTLKQENIEKWFAYIFKDSPKILAYRPTLMNIIANNLIDVKLSF